MEESSAIKLDVHDDPLLLALRRPNDDHNYAAHEWSKHISAAEANAQVDAAGDNNEEWRSPAAGGAMRAGRRVGSVRDAMRRGERSGEAGVWKGRSGMCARVYAD